MVAAAGDKAAANDVALDGGERRWIVAPAVGTAEKPSALG